MSSYTDIDYINLDLENTLPSKFFKIMDIVIALISLVVVFVPIFIYPLLTQKFPGMTYWDRFSVYFGGINFPKTIVLSCLILIMFGIYYIFRKKKFNENFTGNNILVIILLIIAVVLFSLFVLLFLPKHCPFYLCSYSTPEKKALPNKYFNFFVIGDIQNHTSLGEKKNFWNNRANATSMYIQAINDLDKSFRNNDLSNIEYDNMTESDIEEFKKIISEDAIGLINVGDCTQFGIRTGSLNGANDVGLYEFAFGNNPSDGGLLKIPTFETLGNHDYDAMKITKELKDYDEYVKEKGKSEYINNMINTKLLWGKVPMRDMMIRRNKKRKYVIDIDEKYGNYTLDLGEINLYFVNVNPSSCNLIHPQYPGGNAKGSIEYLKQQLKKYPNKKWILVTHSVPLIHPEEREKSCSKDYLLLLDKYKSTYVSTMVGHNHRSNILKYRPQIYVFPGPANFSRYYPERPVSIYNNPPQEIGERFDLIRLAYFSYSTSNGLIMYSIDCINQDDNSFKYKIKIKTKQNKPYEEIKRVISDPDNKQIMESV